MSYLLPTRSQWDKWSLPSKLTCIGTFIGLISLIYAVAFNSWPSGKQDAGRDDVLTAEARRVVDEIIASAATKKRAPSLVSDLSLGGSLSKDLERNPYNVRALILRGQGYYVETKMSGGLQFREAIADFEKAAGIDKSLADPHFGLATVLYQMSLFDIADRGLYKVHKKGMVLYDQATATPRIRPPIWEFFPDTRTRLVLQSALDEFQRGKRLKQIYQQGEGGTVTFFAPTDIENRVRSVRTLMGYEPLVQPDIELVMNFSSILRAVEAGGFGQVLELKADTSALSAQDREQLANRYGREAEGQYRQGNIGEAMKKVDLAVKGNPRDSRHRILRAMVYGRRGNWQAAVADLTAAIQIDPTNANSIFQRAVAYQNLGQKAEAIADFEKCLRLHPAPAVEAAAKEELKKLR